MLRLVFDAAAKSEGISLNDVQLPGPDYLSGLSGVLMRFRERKLGYPGDIAEMFHHVQIRKEDRCAQRFLSREPGNSDIQTYEMQVMIFGATCLPCSAQFVLNGIVKYYNEFSDSAKDVSREFLC